MYWTLSHKLIAIHQTALSADPGNLASAPPNRYHSCVIKKGVFSTITIHNQPPLFPEILHSIHCWCVVLKALKSEIKATNVGQFEVITVGYHAMLLGMLPRYLLCCLDSSRERACLSLRKCAKESGTCFGFGHACLWKAFRMQECKRFLELRSRREYREKSGHAVGPAWKRWKPGGRRVLVFFLLAREYAPG